MLINIKVIVLALIGISTLKIVDAKYKRITRSNAIQTKHNLLAHGFTLMTTQDIEYAKVLVNTFLNEDPLCIATGVSSDVTSREFLLDKWLSYIKENKSFVWIKNGNPIALNILHVDDGSSTSIPTRMIPELGMYYEILNDPNLSVDMGAKYQVNRFLMIDAFWIHKDHRTDQNILKIFQFIEAICVLNGFELGGSMLEAISGYFTQPDLTVASYPFGYGMDGVLSAAEIVQKYGNSNKNLSLIPYQVSRRTLRFEISLQ